MSQRIRRSWAGTKETSVIILEANECINCTQNQDFWGGLKTSLRSMDTNKGL
jgi:hypothetical protein